MLRPHPSSTQTVQCFWTTVHSWPWQSLPWDYRILFLIEFSFVELGTIFHFMRIPECGAAGYGVGDDMMRWTCWIVRVRENPVAWGSCRDKGGCPCSWEESHSPTGNICFNLLQHQQNRCGRNLLLLRGFHFSSQVLAGISTVRTGSTMWSPLSNCGCNKRWYLGISCGYFSI